MWLFTCLDELLFIAPTSHTAKKGAEDLGMVQKVAYFSSLFLFIAE
jgi:hypothetical protein